MRVIAYLIFVSHYVETLGTHVQVFLRFPSSWCVEFSSKNKKKTSQIW